MENRLLFLLFLACIVTCVVAYPQTKCGSEASHDLFLGRRLPGDKFVYLLQKVWISGDLGTVNLGLQT
ncbi:uncharacterized protein isoform X2 [Rhodnius prolixus]|uniref:uncharacterized protein isoform X2 n=1 Tax=Rhodnius prolixus TaxID=13249 RepID=UPI003D18CD21